MGPANKSNDSPHANGDYVSNHIIHRPVNDQYESPPQTVLISIPICACNRNICTDKPVTLQHCQMEKLLQISSHSVM